MLKCLLEEVTNEKRMKGADRWWLVHRNYFKFKVSIKMNMKEKMGFFGKSLQRGFTLIELAIVVVVGGVILIAVFAQGKNMFDTANATQDSKDFVLMTKDLAFFYDGNVYTSLDTAIASNFAPSRMVLSGTTVAMRNAGGGSVIIDSGRMQTSGGAADDAIIIESKAMSKKYCIKLVELASKGFSKIKAKKSGGSYVEVKSLSASTHSPGATTTNCNSTNNDVKLWSY